MLGDFELASPLLQAALSGYSDYAMRVLARRMGAAYTICEVMLDKFLVEIRKSRKNRHAVVVGDDEHPVGGQLMGADPELFGPAARKLVEYGFDVIDINFGCPVKKVLGRCRGGFHLSQPAVAIDIMQRVREAVPAEIPVTVKMRRGIDDSAESRDHFFEIFDAAFDAGLVAVTVHGRTVTQRYDGPSRWDLLREIVEHANGRTVIGSGDLFDASACVGMLEHTGVSGLSIARGAIGNPWIFEQTRSLALGETPRIPGLHEQRDMIREHLRLAGELYGDKLAARRMKKFGVQYAQWHPEYERIRTRVVQAASVADWEDMLQQDYARDLPGRSAVIDEPNPLLAGAT